MNITEQLLFDIRKTLLGIYSDNGLQHAGYGIALGLAAIGETTGRKELEGLVLGFFPALLAATLVFALFMLVRSVFWGRMTFVTVMNDIPVSVWENKPDPMKETYEFHLRLTKENYSLVYKIGYASLRWGAAASIVSFLVVLLLDNMLLLSIPW